MNISGSIHTKLVALLLTLAATNCLTGCNLGDTTVVNDTANLAQASGTLTGRLMDDATNQPIGGATVAIIVNGTKQTAVTDNSTDPDLIGYFSFGNLPAGIHTFKVSLDGYAPIESVFTIDQSSDNTPVTTNMGEIALRKPFTLTVIVTSDGSPVEGVTVIAYPQVTGVTSGVTDAAGHVEISGLDQTLTYSIVAPPADVDGDGVYDYQAAATYYDGATNSDKTLSFPIYKAQRDDPISLAYNSLSRYGYPHPTLTRRNISGLSGENVFQDAIKSFASPNETVYLVFNYPVALDGAISAIHRRILVDPDLVNNATTVSPGDGIVDSNFNTDESLALSYSLDASGTILTISPPPGGYPKNDVITFDGVVKADIGGISTKVPLSTLLGSTYIFDDTSSGLSAASILTADNYNGTSNDYVSLSQSYFYIEFPEYVDGTISYISMIQTKGTASTSDDEIYLYGGYPNPIFTSYPDPDITYTDGASSATCPNCGTGAGVRFRAPFPSYGNVPALDGNLITFRIDVRDVEGNWLQGTYTLTIQ